MGWWSTRRGAEGATPAVSERSKEPSRALPSRALPSRALIALLVGCLVFAAAPRLARAFPSPPPLPVSLEAGPDGAVVAELTRAQRHHYAVRVPAGQVIGVAVDQRHQVDVVLRLLDARGQVIASMDRPTGNAGTERLTWRAEATTTVIVEVEGYGGTGRYRIELDGPRPLRPDDPVRISAERSWSHAQALRRRFRSTDPEASDDAARTAWRLLGERTYVAYERAAWWALRAGDPTLAVVAGRRAAAALEALGEIDRAAGRFERAWRLGREVGEDRQATLAANDAGRLHDAAGRWERSEIWYVRALRSNRRDPRERDELSILGNLAGSHHRQGELAAGFLTLDRQLELARRLLARASAAADGSPEASRSPVRAQREVAGVLVRLIDLHLLVDQIDRAEGRVEQLLEVVPPDAADPGLRLVRAVALARRGRIALERDRLDGALEHLDVARELLTAVLEETLAREPVDGRLVERARTEIAVARVDAGRTWRRIAEETADPERREDAYQQAGRAYLDAADSYLRLGHDDDYATTLLNLAYMEDRRGRPQNAHPLYRRIQPMVVDDPARRASFDYAWARHLMLLGDLGEAERVLAASLERVEHLRRETDSLDRRMTLLAGRRAYYELYVDLAMELDRERPGVGWAARAFEVADQAKGRVLVDLLAESSLDLDRDLDPRLLERERQIRERIRRIHRQLHDGTGIDAERREPASSGSPTPELAGRLEEELERLRGELEDLDARLRRASRRYDELMAPRPLDLEEVRRRVLDDETQILAYSLGDERSHAWLLGRTTLLHWELPPRAEIEALVSRARRQLERSHQPLHRRASRSAARDLAAVVLHPASVHLERPRLLVVPDGALHAAPLGALPVPTSTGEEPLMARVELSTLPSISLVPVLREQPRSLPRLTFALVGDPVFRLDDPRLDPDILATAREPISLGSPERGVGDLSRLPHSGREVHSIAALVEPTASRLLEGFEANRTRVMDGAVEEARYVHFATHGWVAPEGSQVVALVLSRFDADGAPRDPFLHLEDIFDLDLSADLVVLSACDTGLGATIRGEGLLNLTRGFLFAGARRVLVSLWSVDDRATADLMEDFYRHLLLDRVGPAAALRLAQIAAREDPERSAPYYWAGFMLQGDPETVPPSRPVAAASPDDG